MSVMDEQTFVEECTRQWVHAVIVQGTRCFEAVKAADEAISNRQGRDWAEMSRTAGQRRVEEHYFVIAVGKAMDWLQELKRVRPNIKPKVEAFLKQLPHAMDVRNMREHDIEYFKGKGHNQERFNYGHTDASGQIMGYADASSTIIIGDDYLIGGRLDVGAAIKAAELILPDIVSPPSWLKAIQPE